MKISDLDNNTFARIYNTSAPLLLRGAPGIAKTAKVMQFCEEKGLGLVVELLPAMDAPDAMGFLIPSKDADGSPVSRYAKPNWLQRIEATGKEQGVLLLDEFLAADHLVMKAFAPLMSERAIGQWQLPDGWVVWMTGNRQSDKAGANRILSHITNRLFLIDVSSDPKGWAAWASDHGVHPMIVAFALARPDIVFSDEPSKDPNAPACTPRSLTKVNDLLTMGVEGNNLPTDNISRELVAGAIGEGAAMELFSFISTRDELPEIEDILADPKGAKLPAEHRLDAQYVAAQMCVHYANAETVEPLFVYATRLNRELQTSVAMQMLRKSGGALHNSKVLSKWIAENKALITATTV